MVYHDAQGKPRCARCGALLLRQVRVGRVPLEQFECTGPNCGAPPIATYGREEEGQP